MSDIFHLYAPEAKRIAIALKDERFSLVGPKRGLTNRDEMLMWLDFQQEDNGWATIGIVLYLSQMAVLKPIEVEEYIRGQVGAANIELQDYVAKNTNSGK